MTVTDTSTADRSKSRGYEIAVNGTLFEVHDDTVTYDEVVHLGFPHTSVDIIYSVAFRKAKGGHGGSGMLVPGTAVKVKKKGTSFDVTATTRS